MADYAQALARVLQAKINQAATTFARGTVVSTTTDGFVTFTDAMGSARKGVWTNVQPLAGDYITYVDTGGGFPIVLGSAGSRTWIQPTLLNSWANFSADHGFEWAAYRMIGDIVYLRGLIKNGTVGGGVPIFTLPAGYRPLHQHLFGIMTDTAGPILGRLDIAPTGDVILSSGGNGFASLSGVQFSTV